MEGDYNKPLIADPEFDSLIPKPRGITESIKRNALLEDTIEFLPNAVKRVTWQVKKIAPLLEADTLEKTCKNIWTRLYNGIRYCKDEKNKEQIKSPRCTWWQKKGDCDDFSVFVSAILSNLKIPHVFRIAMYKEEEGYQHIYPVVIAPDGTEIVIDCVLSRFNKEVPYIKKIDKEMELQFLDGVDDEFLSDSVGNIDAQDLLRGDLGDLGRKKFKDSKFAKKLKQGLHNVNRVNPATTLLRVGILASLKINLFNVAGILRYTYLSDEQARQKSFIMSKFPKLRVIREKLEKIFYVAGGKEENFKKAILTGHGNKNKEVPLSGLGSIEGTYNENDELPQLLGIDTYNSEINETVSLGDPATGTAIAAASSALAAIAAIIKSLGALKGGKKSDAASSDGSTTADTSTITSSADSTSNTSPVDNSGAGADNAPPIDKSTTNKTDTTSSTDGGANKADTPAAATDGSEGDGSTKDETNNQRSTNPAAKDDKSKTPAKSDGLMQRFTTWASANKGEAIGLGVASAAVLAGLIYGGIKLANRNKTKKAEKEPEKEASKEPEVVSGVSKRKEYFGAQKQRVIIQKLR